ncbi:MAG: hypothetical protein U1F36_06450 [Planctomycetota bacterium]
MIRNPERREVGALALLFAIVVIATLAGGPQTGRGPVEPVETAACVGFQVKEVGRGDAIGGEAHAMVRRGGVFGERSESRGLLTLAHGLPRPRAPTAIRG